MYAKTYGVCVSGIDGYVVTVEVDISPGLPSFDIVGLPATSVKEAKERVRSAIKNGGFEFPMKRIVVNLAPAHIRKDGSSLDLAIAMGILAAQESGKHKKKEVIHWNHHIFIGELSLDGSLQPVMGMLSMVMGVTNQELGNDNNYLSMVEDIIVPIGNHEEAISGSSIPVYGLSTLAEVVEVLEDPEKKEMMQKSIDLYINRKTLGFLRDPIDEKTMERILSNYKNEHKVSYWIQRTRDKLKQMKISQKFILEISHFETRFLEEKYHKCDNMLLMYFMSMIVYMDINNKDNPDRNKVACMVFALDRVIRNKMSEEQKKIVIDNIIALEDQFLAKL